MSKEPIFETRTLSDIITEIIYQDTSPGEQYFHLSVSDNTKNFNVEKSLPELERVMFTDIYDG